MLPWIIGGAAGISYLVGRAVLRMLAPGVPDPMDIAFWLTCEAETYTDLQNRLPNEPGVYAFYFDTIPGNIDVANCFRNEAWTLLYVGKAKSLRARVLGDHFNGSDATQSGAIRETVGALLGLPVHKKGRDVWTFGPEGEKWLSSWIREHARVSWASMENEDLSWPQLGTQEMALGQVEGRLVDSCFELPLNRDQRRSKIAAQAVRAWKECKRQAGNS